MAGARCFHRQALEVSSRDKFPSQTLKKPIAIHRSCRGGCRFTTANAHAIPSRRVAALHTRCLIWLAARKKNMEVYKRASTYIEKQPSV